MSVACTIGMAELQHDGKCKNDQKSGAIVFTGGTGISRVIQASISLSAIQIAE
jgi:hypothetical protein